MQALDNESEPFGVDQRDVAGAVLIDVRRVPAFEKSAHMLPTAVWRDPAQVDEWAGSLDPARAVIVYCVYGHEVSRGVALRLRAGGFNTHFLRGGIDAWQNAGLPVVTKGETA